MAAKPPVDVEFRLGRDNGYVVDFAASAQGRRGGAVLIASGRRGGAYYLKPRAAEVTPRRVRADFGPIGRVSVRFEERDRDVTTAPKGCEGRMSQRYGLFRGGFRFRGEREFARVRGRRARGEVTMGGPFTCDAVPAPVRRRAASYYLTTCGPPSAPVYTAQGFGRSVDHAVEAVSRRAGLIIVRNAGAVGDRDSLAVSGDGATATLEPPRPFSGSAEYADGRLTGDLTVPLPGLERPVRLTPSRADLDRLREGSGFGCGGDARVAALLRNLLR